MEKGGYQNDSLLFFGNILTLRGQDIEKPTPEGSHVSSFLTPGA